MKEARGYKKGGKKKGKKFSVATGEDSDDDPTTLKLSKPDTVKLDVSFLNGFSKIMVKFNR